MIPIMTSSHYSSNLPSAYNLVDRATNLSSSSHRPAPPPPLDNTQQAEFGRWQPLPIAFPDTKVYSPDLYGSNITQDNVADCSVVTALIVAAEHHRKFSSRVGQIDLDRQC